MCSSRKLNCTKCVEKLSKGSNVKHLIQAIDHISCLRLWLSTLMILQRSSHCIQNANMKFALYQWLCYITSWHFSRLWCFRHKCIRIYPLGRRTAMISNTIFINKYHKYQRPLVQIRMCRFWKWRIISQNTQHCVHCSCSFINLFNDMYTYNSLHIYIECNYSSLCYIS